MQFRSPFYLTVQQTAEGLWQSVMRTRAWGPDELWATGSFDYGSRAEAEREARLWASRGLPSIEDGRVSTRFLDDLQG